jgi:hypothetical protein
MIQKLKNNIRNWLFKDYQAMLDEKHSLLVKHYEDKMKKVSLIDVLAERLKGFNPRLLDNHDFDILDIVGEDDVNDFLNNVKALHENTAMHKIADWITREQVIHTAVNAEAGPELNFGRAIITGLSLFRDKVNELYKIQVERNKPKEQYDEHAIT